MQPTNLDLPTSPSHPARTVSSHTVPARSSSIFTIVVFSFFSSIFLFQCRLSYHLFNSMRLFFCFLTGSSMRVLLSIFLHLSLLRSSSISLSFNFTDTWPPQLGVRITQTSCTIEKLFFLDRWWKSIILVEWTLSDLC